MVEMRPAGGKWARDHVSREWGDFRVGDVIDCKDSTQKVRHGVLPGSIERGVKRLALPFALPFGSRAQRKQRSAI